MPSNSQNNQNPRRNTRPNNSYSGNRASPSYHGNNRNSSLEGTPMKKTETLEGVYKNPKMTWNLTKLVGCSVEVQVLNEKVYEGILKTFSPRLELVLVQAHLIEVNNRGAIPAKDVLIDNFIINLEDVVYMSAIDADVIYGELTDSFTDSAIISRSQNGAVVKERELQKWEPEGDDEGLALDTDRTSGTGWSPEAMFKMNEQRHGVKSDFDGSMHLYTTPLKVENTPEYNRRRQEAERQALEIEMDPNSRRNLAKENGDANDGKDEEDRFSAVVRPSHNNDTPKRTDKYYPPQQRGQRDSPARGGRSSNSDYHSGNRFNSGNERRNDRNKPSPAKQSQFPEELRKFHQKFNLKGEDSQKSTPAQPSKPHEPEEKQQKQLNNESSKVSNPTKPKEAPATPTTAVPPTTSTPATPASTTETKTPTTDPGASPVVKSTLNPDAKEFVFRPAPPSSPSVAGVNGIKTKTATVSVRQQQQDMITTQQAMGQPLISAHHQSFINPHGQIYPQPMGRTLQRIPSHPGQEGQPQVQFQTHHALQQQPAAASMHMQGQMIPQYPPQTQAMGGPPPQPNMPPTPPALHTQSTPQAQASQSQQNLIQTSIHQPQYHHNVSQQYMYTQQMPAAPTLQSQGQQAPPPQQQQHPPPQPSPHHPSVSPAPNLNAGQMPYYPAPQQFHQQFYHTGGVPASMAQAAAANQQYPHAQLVMVPQGPGVPSGYTSMAQMPLLYPQQPGHFPQAPNFQPPQ